MLTLGAVGVVSVASHVVGDDIKAMIRAHREGDLAKALELHQRMMPVFKALFITTNPIPVKWAMSLLGMDLGPFRLPLVEPSAGGKGPHRRGAHEYGLLSAGLKRDPAGPLCFISSESQV